MTKGLDVNTPLTDHAGCMKGAGIEFVCRYYKEAASSLTRAEAEALSAAGLYIVSIVELGFPTSARYFSHSQGLADGAWAYDRALECGQPGGSPIYFAVDYDAAPDDIAGCIQDYFDGIRAAFAARSAHSGYAIGVYGSGAVCAHLLQHTLVSYAWLAMSMGWRGSRVFTGWNIRQTIGDNLCGLNIDRDESNGHGGGWKTG